MQDLYGQDIGNTIDFRTAGSFDAQHPWPSETITSAGHGVVFKRNPKEGEPGSYQTLFLEVYPPGAAFIRGEGETPEDCENAAWAKYELALHCVDHSDAHDWQPRGYQNGAGFCSRCNTFGSQVFTGEQLGQFCKVCQEPTTYHWGKDPSGNPEFLCEKHTPPHPGWGDDEETGPISDQSIGDAIIKLHEVLVGLPTETSPTTT